MVARVNVSTWDLAVFTILQLGAVVSVACAVVVPLAVSLASIAERQLTVNTALTPVWSGIWTVTKGVHSGRRPFVLTGVGLAIALVLASGLGLQIITGLSRLSVPSR